MTAFNTKAIVRNIKKWRENHNLSQAELAKILEITPATLCRVERGETLMRTCDIQKLLDHTDLDPNYFFYDYNDSGNEMLEIHITKKYMGIYLAIVDDFKEMLNKK